MVSRQAITKWETDKGIPDVDNLKAISNLLNVSIEMRKPVTGKKFEKGDMKFTKCRKLIL